MTGTITFLGQELSHIPDEEEGLYGVVYKNETLEVRTSGDDDSCNFWMATLLHEGQTTPLHAYSKKDLESRVLQKREHSQMNLGRGDT